MPIYVNIRTHKHLTYSLMHKHKYLRIHDASVCVYVCICTSTPGKKAHVQYVTLSQDIWPKANQ